MVLLDLPVLPLQVEYSDYMRVFPEVILHGIFCSFVHLISYYPGGGWRAILDRVCESFPDSMNAYTDIILVQWGYPL